MKEYLKKNKKTLNESIEDNVKNLHKDIRNGRGASLGGLCEAYGLRPYTLNERTDPLSMFTIHSMSSPEEFFRMMQDRDKAIWKKASMKTSIRSHKLISAPDQRL